MVVDALGPMRQGSIQKKACDSDPCRTASSGVPGQLGPARRRIVRRCLARLGRAGLLLLLCLLGAEVAARVVSGKVGPARAERRALLARIPGAGADSNDDGPLAAAFRASSAGFALHPFFGYTAAPGANGVNNQGFVADGAPYPYRKADDEFVIALFGGSVAGQLYGSRQAFVSPLEAALRARGFRRLRLISFALGGWRQPQSFFAFEFYLPTFDMAVTLDGFNEIIHTGDGELNVYPASFPFSAVWAPLAHQAGSPERALRTADLIRANRSMASWTRLLDASPLRNSALAHLVWRVAVAHYQRATDAMRTAEQNETLVEWQGFEPAVDGAVATKRREYLALYERLVEDTSRIARARGVPSFHFVQPNQYDRGSKPLSEEERRERVTNDWSELVTTQYGELREMIMRLRARGIQSNDLTGLFAHTDETVYSDSCCHLNERGLAMLGAAMADRILSSGVIDSLTPRDGRPTSQSGP